MGSDNPISRPTPRDSFPPERLLFQRGPPFSKLTDYQAAIFHIQIAAETTGVLSSLSKDSTRQMLGAVFCSESLSRYPENFDTLRPAWVTSEGTWTSSWWPKQEEGSFLPFQAGSSGGKHVLFLCTILHPALPRESSEAGPSYHHIYVTGNWGQSFQGSYTAWDWPDWGDREWTDLQTHIQKSWDRGARHSDEDTPVTWKHSGFILYSWLRRWVS